MLISLVRTFATLIDGEMIIEKERLNEGYAIRDNQIFIERNLICAIGHSI